MSRLCHRSSKPSRILYLHVLPVAFIKLKILQIYNFGWTARPVGCAYYQLLPNNLYYFKDSSTLQTCHSKLQIFSDVCKYLQKIIVKVLDL